MNKFALTTVAGIPSNGASAFVKPEVVTEQRPSHEPTRITSKGYENGKWLVEAKEDWKPTEPWVVMEFDGPDLTQNVEMNPVKVEVVEHYYKDTEQPKVEYDKAVLSYDGMTEIVMDMKAKKRQFEKSMLHAQRYSSPKDLDAARYSQASREADLAAVKAAFERGEEIEWLSMSGEWKTASKANNNKLGFIMEPKNYRLADPYRHLKEAWKAGKTIQFSSTGGGVWHSILNGEEPEWCFGPECYRVMPRPTTAELIEQKQRDRKEAQSRFDRDYPGPLWVAKDGRAIPVSKMETSHLINAYNHVKKVSRTSHIHGLSAETWRKLFDEELDKRYSEKRREDWTADARL